VEGIARWPTNGEWFERFMLGYHKRVGDVSRPDLAISIEVMVALMVRFEGLWILADGDGSSQEKVLFPALFAILTYTGGLRGEETPLMDLHATAKHYQEGINHPTHPHVVMALRGRFKNEVGELEHLKPLAVETKSGLKVGVWFKRMLSWYEARGVTRGPVFRDSRGNRARAGHYELAILTEVFSRKWSGCKSRLTASFLQMWTCLKTSVRVVRFSEAPILRRLTWACPSRRLI
jgi:hypothetical protein